MRDKTDEQRIFAVSKRQNGLTTRKPPCCRIELKVPEADLRLARIRRELCRGLLSADYSTNASYQFGGLERLCHVVISTAFQPGDFVGQRTFCSQHDDWNWAAFSAQRAADCESVSSRKHQIQDDAIIPFPQKKTLHVVAISGIANFHFMFAQISPQHAPQASIVFDHKDFDRRHGAHVMTSRLEVPPRQIRPLRPDAGNSAFCTVQAVGLCRKPAGQDAFQ